MDVEDKIGKWQHGFRLEICTTNLIFSMLTKEKVERKGKLEKRDWIVLENPIYDVLEILIMFLESMSEKLINMIKATCNERFLKCKRRWSVLSQVLFVLYLNKNVKKICIRENREHMLVYATVITSGSCKWMEWDTELNGYNDMQR